MFKGVTSLIPGYTGGTKVNPTYEEVCGGSTGHVEVIRIEYDAELVTFGTLLTVFFATHDPTTLNRQGNDVGTQYRSSIFYTTEEQKQESEACIKSLNDSNTEGKPIITEVRPLGEFYPAETYHQDYFAKNPQNPYCQVVISPKLEKVQQKFAEILKNA